MAAFFFVLVGAGWSFGQTMAPDDPVYVAARSEGQRTGVTETRGENRGRRVVRGREAESPADLAAAYGRPL